MAKSNANTVQVRVAEVAKLLIRCNSRADILRYCAENYKVGQRQADSYIKMARERIEESANRNINYEYAIALKRYEELYLLAMNGQSYKLAMQIVKEMTGLLGMAKNPPAPTTNEEAKYYLKTLTTDELKAKIAQYADPEDIRPEHRL